MTEDRVVYGTENNSTLLECVPRSPQATVTWLIQHNDHKEEVRQLVNSHQFIIEIKIIKQLPNPNDILMGGRLGKLWATGWGEWNFWQTVARVTTFENCVWIWHVADTFDSHLAYGWN